MTKCEHTEKFLSEMLSSDQPDNVINQNEKHISACNECELAVASVKNLENKMLGFSNSFSEHISKKSISARSKTGCDEISRKCIICEL